MPRNEFDRRAFMAAGPAALVGLGSIGTLGATGASAQEAPISPGDEIKVTKLKRSCSRLLGLRQDLHRRRNHRLGRDAQGRRQSLRRRRPRSRPATWSARIRVPWSTTGRPSTVAPSTAAARSRPPSLSGIDMALWDISGKCYGVPAYKLLGGPTRERIRGSTATISAEDRASTP